MPLPRHCSADTLGTMRHGHSHSHSHGADGHAAELGLVPAVERSLKVAVLVCAALTLVGLVLLWPSGDRSSLDPAVLGADPVEARVQSTVEQPCSYDALLPCVLVTIGVTSGDTSGEVFTIEQSLGGAGRPLTAGDDILVLADRASDGTMIYSFYEHQRSTPMLLLVLLFATVIVVFGRWKGVGALAGLTMSLAVIVVFVLPSLLDGNNAVLVALVGTSLIAFVALYLAHGLHPTTSVALVSTFAALVVTGALSWVFIAATRFTGYTDDSTQFLDALSVPIDPRGILLAGIVIGSLGVLDDVTVTQVSAVWELRAAQPTMSSSELVRAALRIGRDHISSTVNTLFLAYAGAALPLLLLFSEASQGIGSVATREIVAVEIVRSLIGSIGLVSAVPISTWLAAQVVRPHDPAAAVSATMEAS